MSDLRERVIAYNREIKTALETFYNALNHGQRMQIVKDEAVREIFERYGVEIDGSGEVT